MKFNRKYRILKEDDINAYLTTTQREMLDEVIYWINHWRHKDGKKDNTYLVINTDEPYIKEIAEILVRHGHCAKDGDKDVIEVG